jgi:hypothetical protein
MFRRPNEPAPVPPWQRQEYAPWDTSPRPATTLADPQAQEISLAELLAQMGTTTDSQAVRFTAEGGIVQG